MAIPILHCLALTMFTITGILLLGGSSQVSGQTYPCGAISGLVVLEGCLNFIRKDWPQTPPSPDCCKIINQIGMTCTCKTITKEIENTISMEKLVYVAQSCGQPLAHGTQCGSYKVPTV